MAIFAAIFSLVNINMQMLAAGSLAVMVVVVNLATIGSFAFLAGIIALVLRQDKRSVWPVLWGAAAVLVIVAAAIAFFGLSA